MINDVGLVKKVSAFIVSSETIYNQIETYITHPLLFIIFFSALMYAGGIHNARREKNIAKYTLTPILRKILFFNYSCFTLRNIVFQIYLVVVTAISIAIILFPIEVSSNKVAEIYASVTFLAFLVIQVAFSLIQLHK